MSTAHTEIHGLDRVMNRINRIRELDGPLMQRFLEKCGFDFLDVIQDQIISMQVVDTRLLLNSFQPGGAEGLWKIQDGGLTLLVGTNVKYARAVNDGHWTTPSGVKQRWVPGTWSGDRFEYNPGASTGMLLKRKFVEGRPYWDNAVAIYTTMFGRDMSRLISNWLRTL